MGSKDLTFVHRASTFLTELLISLALLESSLLFCCFVWVLFSPVMFSGSPGLLLFMSMVPSLPGSVIWVPDGQVPFLNVGFTNTSDSVYPEWAPSQPPRERQILAPGRHSEPPTLTSPPLQSGPYAWYGCLGSPPPYPLVQSTWASSLWCGDGIVPSQAPCLWCPPWLIVYHIAIVSICSPFGSGCFMT